MSDRVVWWQHSVAVQTWLERIANALPARAIVCYSQDAAARSRLGCVRRGRPWSCPPGQRPCPPIGVLRRSTPPPGVPVIGIVGRLQPWKGQDRLLEAVALLRERGLAIHLLIVGGDSYGLSPDYAAALPR